MPFCLKHKLRFSIQHTQAIQMRNKKNLKDTDLSLLSVKDCFDPELPDTVISTVPANSDDDLSMITLAVNSRAVHKRNCCCE